MTEREQYRQAWDLVEILAQAATVVEQVLAGTTGGPWWSHDTEQCFTLHGVAGRLPAAHGVPEQVVSAQILKARKADREMEPYWPSAADGTWMTTMNPLVGPPIAALLRRAHQRASEHIPAWTAPSGGVEEPPAACYGDPDRLVRLVRHHFGPEIELAQVLLRLDDHNEDRNEE